MMLMDRSEREFRQSAAIASRALLRAQLLAGQHEITCPKMLCDRLLQSEPIVAPAVRQMLPTSGKGGPVAVIQRLVCRHFGVSLIDLKSKRQARTYSIPRQAAMYLAKRFTTYSLPEIGRCFGGKDHTTVIWATHATVARRRDDPEFNEKLAWIEAEIIAAGEAS